MPPLTERERHPLLTDDGRRRLRGLLEHPSAPRWNHACGDRLDAARLAEVRAFAATLHETPPPLDDWLPAHLARCRREVPFYRKALAHLPEPAHAEDLRLFRGTTRADLREAPWDFVPDGALADELLVYGTNGTTGPRVIYPSHPTAPALYLPLLEFAAGRHGVRIEPAGDVLWMQVGCQRRTMVYASAMTYYDFRGFVKVNLDPIDWRDPADGPRFVRACAPQVVTGDPFALVRLAELVPELRPRVVFSAGLTLAEGVRRSLETAFGCPVIDYYSLNETGPLAFRRGGAFEAFPHPLLLELLDDAGTPVPPGSWGEVCFTGALNRSFPLIRYRTGDRARRAADAGPGELTELVGRAPVVFRRTDGTWFNSIDVAMAVRDLSLAGWTISQETDGSVRFVGRTAAWTVAAEIRELHDALDRLLGEIFGPTTVRRIEFVDPAAPLEGKWISYRSPWEPHRLPEPGTGISTSP